MKKVLSVIVASVAAALFTACSGPGGGVVGQVQDVVADLVLPPQQEAQLGDRMAREIEAQQKLHPSAALQQQVAAIGARIRAQAAAMPYDFTFKVVDDPRTVNAFALPGGHIYVTSGLVELAGDEAQLASVVAHEVAHVTERHIAQRLATSYGLQVLGAAALGQDPGTVGQLVGSVLQQGFLLKYSREQELEADRVGLGFLRQAGYDPRAAVAMFRKLAAAGGDGGPTFLSSHPFTGQRIEQLEQLIAGRR